MKRTPEDAPVGLGAAAERAAELLARIAPAEFDIIHRIDDGMIGPTEAAAKLEIIGRVREDEIDRGFGQLQEFFDAIADDDAIVLKTRKIWLGR